LCQSFKDSDIFRDTSIRRVIDPLGGDRLLKNELTETGKLKFTDVSKASGIYSSAVGFGLGLSISDVNNDGWPDIYVGNDFHENDYLYINLGNGRFSEESQERIPHGSTFSMGNDIADINNDGLGDIMTLDMKPEDYEVYKSSSGIDEYNVYQYKLNFGYQNQYSQNCLMLNTGNGQYLDVANSAGVSATDWSWSVLMEDFDQDGLKDIFVSNGIAQRPNDLDYLNFAASEMAKLNATDEAIASKMPQGSQKNYFFKNQNGTKFRDTKNDWIGFNSDLSNGAAVGDLDLDGDVDVVVNRINENALILENRNKHVDYLTVDVLPKWRSWFLGSKVALYHRGEIQVEEIKSTRGFQSSSEPVAFFGLKEQGLIDSVIVTWPDFTRTKILDVPSNQRLLIAPDNNKEIIIENSQSNISISFVENTHNGEDDKELSGNRLAPWSRSGMGPLMEVNQAKGLQLYPYSVYAVMSQRNDGLDFSKMHQFKFTETGAGYLEGVKVNNIDLGLVNDAVWEDMDNDGRPDLVIASEWKPLQILFNLPSGFQLSSLPNSTGLWRSIAVADVDGDGVKDIVAGNMGTNLPLSASRTKPLHLFVGDFNDNGAPLPLLAHYVDGRLKPFETRNTLGAAIPSVKKKYQSYNEFAKADVTDIFGPILDTIEQFTAQIMESMIFYGKAEGGYEFVKIPAQAQVTCMNDILVEDINRDGLLDLVVAGNLFEMSPALGRLDGSAIQVLYNNGDRQYSVENNWLNYNNKGQARQILKIAEGEILISFYNSKVRKMQY